MRTLMRAFCLAAVLVAASGSWCQSVDVKWTPATKAAPPKVAKLSSSHESKIAPQISQLAAQARRAPRLTKFSSLSNKLARLNDSGEVQLYVGVPDTSEATLKSLRSRGLRIEIADSKHRTVQGWLPVESLESLATLPSVLHVRAPGYGRLRMGAVMTEGDAILRSNMVRQSGVQGEGVKVGVLSNGVQNRDVSRAMGDLPSLIQIDPAYPGAGDEGTALLEIVYDVAPRANLAFSGPITSLEFMRGVGYLVNSFQCKVVFDDIGFYTEPYFEDGAVAQTVADAISSGVVYVSPCGNDARSHYQALYNDWNPGATGWPNDLHAFGPGDADLAITIPPRTEIVAFLQWGDRWGRADNDYDLFLYDDRVTTALAWSNAIQNGDDDPYEAFSYYNNSDVAVRARVLVDRARGTTRHLELFFWDVSAQEYVVTNDSIFGHPAVTGVLSVGAINAAQPGNNRIANYSSVGPSTVFWPTYRQRGTPRITAIDGVSVTGVGAFPTPFYGTSAAAAHVAGIAALLMSKEPTLPVAEIIRKVEAATVDLGSPGFDNVYGYGRLDALRVIPPTGARHWHLLP